VNQFRIHPAALDMQPRNRDRKFKSSGARASRINEQDSIAFLNEGPVRMSTDHGVKPGRAWIKTDLLEIVDEVNTPSFNVRLVCFGDFSCPFGRVVISTHRD